MGANVVFQSGEAWGGPLDGPTRTSAFLRPPPFSFSPPSQSIFSNSRDVDPALVQKAIMAMLRLCQRLLPYKTDISEPLMKGEQYNGRQAVHGTGCTVDRQYTDIQHT